jgi:hypothetical protein
MNLAPNGKPSNLKPEQYKLVRTPEFKAWFGDWENSTETASKIVDENGEPLTCFHGSNKEFNVFEENYLGSAHDMGFYGRGFYFTFNTDPKWMWQGAIGEAGYYGKIVKPYFIKALNPFDFSSLKKYKGVRINFHGTKSLVFLYNIAEYLPKLAEIITIDKSTYNRNSDDYDITQIPISVLPNLIRKYSNDLVTFETERGGQKYINGYLKSKSKEVFYDNTATGGTKGSYIDFDTLSYGIDSRTTKVEVEILLIEKALEKYDGISVRYHPEGYMTRYPQITDEIKKNHDCIMQSKDGDELVVFDNKRIKLADGTNTTFDANNPDIRYKNGGYIGSCVDVGSGKKEVCKYFPDATIMAQYVGNPDENDWGKSKETTSEEFYKFVSKYDVPKKAINGEHTYHYIAEDSYGRSMKINETSIYFIYNIDSDIHYFFKKTKYEIGGELTLTSEQVENKLGRKLHWWNDDVVSINGIEYKKVFLKSEYKRLYALGGEVNIENPSTDKYNDIFINGEKVGYIILSPARKEYYWLDINLPNPLAIVDIKILKEFRGKNYMTQTMNWLFNFAKENGHNSLFLRVDDNSEISQETLYQIYSKYGFSTYKTSDDDDDIFMYKLL